MTSALRAGADLRASSDSSLANLCDGIIEAAWLAIVVDVPLFFNKYASGTFEPEKIYLARSLALVILAAWIVRRVATGVPTASVSRNGFTAVFGFPLVWAIIGLVSAKLLATSFTIDSFSSIWGAWGRTTGFYSDLSWLIVCAAVATKLRSRAQLARLVTAIIFTSLPVSLYGIAQHFGVEPMFVFEGSFGTVRVSSSLGNPVFMAAYLALVAPLAFARLIYFLSRWRDDPATRPSSACGIALHVMVLSLLSAAMIFTRSRGPLLGLLIGLLVMCAALGIRRRRQIVALAVAAAVGLPMLFFAATARQALTGHPGASRLEGVAELVAPTAGTGLQRSILWRTAWDAVTTERPLDVGAGRADRLHAWRRIFGYGPDTIEFVIRRYISPELIATYNGLYLTADHVHSDSWDTLIGEGVLGLVAREFLFFCLFWYATVSLRIAHPSRPYSFWGCVVTGALLGGLVLGMWEGIGFFWLGWRFGSVLGLLVFLSTVRSPEADEVRHSSSLDITLLIAALLAAAIAHFIETAFSFAVGTTASYFWLYTGVLVAAGRLVGQPDGPAPASQPASIGERRGRDRNTQSAVRQKAQAPRGMWTRRDEIVGGAVIALVMLNLGFELLRKGSDTNPITIVANALTRVPATHNQFSLWITGIVVASGLLFAVAWVNDHRSTGDVQSRSRSLGVVVSVALGLSAISWGLLAVYLASVRALPPESIDLSGAFDDYATLVVMYYGFTLAFVGILAAALWGRVGAQHPARRHWFVLAATVASVASVVTACLYLGNLRWSYASVTTARAERFKRTDDWNAIRAVYEQAVAIAPSVDQYQALLGNAILKQALATENAAERRRRLDSAETILVAGYARRPLNTAYAANLGDLYLNRAVQETNPQRRKAIAAQGVEYLREVTTLEPARFDSLNKSAYLAVTFFGQSDGALDQLQRSLAIAPAFDETNALLGEVYASKAHAATTPEKRNHFFAQAATAYQAAIARVSRYSYDCALGDVYSEMLDVSRAIKTYRKCVDEAPAEMRSAIDEVIARQYLRLGDRNGALTYSRQALAEAPLDKRAHLIALIEEITQFPLAK